MNAWTTGHAPGELLRCDLDKPWPAPDEVLVRVEACGVCRTDLHVVDRDLPVHRRRVVPGHQVMGTVEVPGPAYGHPLPPTVDAAATAPLLCAGIIGYRALTRTNLPPGGRLGIYGFGSSAHVTAQLALAQGARLSVMTRGEAGRDLARDLGADFVGGATDAPPTNLDAAIVFAPAGELAPHALQVTEAGGTVVLAGIHMSDIPTMAHQETLFHERDLRTVTANTRADGAALLRLATTLGIAPVVTTFPFSRADQAIRALRAGAAAAGSLVVTPG